MPKKTGNNYCYFKGVRKMRKLLIPLITSMLFLVSTTSVYCASTGTWTVSVGIVEAEGTALTITGASASLGYVVKNSSVISESGQRTIVKNTGGVAVTLQLKLTASPFTWSTGTVLNDVDVDKFVLATVFENWEDTPVFSWFADDDVLTGDYKVAGTANGIFASPGTPDIADGVQLAVGEEVSNFYFFNAPTSLTDTTKYGVQGNFTVQVTASP